MDQVLRAKFIHYPVGHADMVAANKVLSHKGPLALTKAANLDTGVKAVLLRILAEKKERGNGKLPLWSHHFQIPEHLLRRIVDTLLGKTSFVDTVCQEVLDGIGINVVKGGTGDNPAVPSGFHLPFVELL